MPAQIPFGSHFASHARDFARETVELIHHRVDGVFQLKNFALHIDGDFSRQVPFRHRRRHLGNVAHLRGKITGHGIHGIRKVLPGARNTGDVRLTTQSALAAHFARHARHFSREAIQLVHHGVERFFQLQNFSAHVHRNLA